MVFRYWDICFPILAHLCAPFHFSHPLILLNNRKLSNLLVSENLKSCPATLISLPTGGEKFSYAPRQQCCNVMGWVAFYWGGFNPLGCPKLVKCCTASLFSSHPPLYLGEKTSSHRPTTSCKTQGWFGLTIISVGCFLLGWVDQNLKC